MLQCIVVDDDATGIDVLASYIKKVPYLELAASFRDPLKALAYLEADHCDIAFLDINMPGINGLQLAKLVEKKEIAIIFCTAYSEYALESYEISAVDYLLKPVPMDRFLKAVSKVKQKTNKSIQESEETQKSSEKIFIKSSDKIHHVSITDLRYMKKDGHYMWITTKDHSLFSRMTMSELLEVLPEAKFIQTHRSFIVAIDHITEVGRHHLMVNGEEIPIGVTYRKDLLKKIDYTGK